jgi:formylglycine-generating enzyme required for sulfatase activity
VAARNAGEAAFYRDLVLARDADGAAAREIRGACTVRMGVAAADAEAYVFRYRVHSEVVPGGESRFVPVPLQETPPAVAPGTRVLVVTRGAGDVKKGDLVLSLGGKPVASLPPREAVALAETGGAAASVHRDGRVLDATLPAGLRVRATAAPLALSPACRRPASPRLEFSGEPGEYLVLVRAPGREDQRVFFDAAPNAVLERAIALAPEGAAAPDFVRVHTMRIDPPFWVLDREVTAAEYLEFLNDPATLAEIAASAAPIRFPRDNSTEHSGGYWPRDAGGRYSLAENLPESAPVLGVSQDDARAYAAWFGRRIGAAERGLVARLPLQEEHATAAGQSSIRNFPFGVTFRPRWAKSCYSTPKPGLEAGLSYPVDESPYAVFDCSGGAREWTDERDRGLGRLCGGSWAIASPDNFQIWYSVRTLPAQGSSQSGFRLVLVPADGRR